MIKAFSSLYALILVFSTSTFAKKMDIETHTIVIEKLERVLTSSKKKPKHNLSLFLRLADLYAERARLNSMKEVEKNCDGCLGSIADREKAIQKYKSITPYVEGEVGATVLMQTAHLYQLVGKNSQAKKLYKNIIKNKSKRSSRVIGQSYSGLAHLQFNDGRYSQALKNYDKAIAQRETPQKGFLIYRKAWCLLNIGKTNKAIQVLKAVLQSPKLLDVSSGTDLVANATFHQDVSRDFASFLVRKNLTARDIDLLDSVSPDVAKKSNLFYLGTEAERVGQKNAALLVWAVYTQRTDVPFEEKLEIQARRAKIHFDLDQKSQALTQYQEALKLWSSAQCKDSVDCEGIYQRLRNFPISWNKQQKKKPTKQIHQAYQAYLAVFNEDFEMWYWSAQVARKLNNYRAAVSDYRKAAVNGKNQRNSADAEKQKSANRIYNGALLAEIEMAELDGHPKVRDAAYRNYLDEIPNGEKSDFIRYQLAHLDYEQKNYQKAAFQFKNLAEKKSVNSKTRLQAADLSIDSLALLKDHSRLEQWGQQYVSLFPKRAKEFQKISGKATLNLVAIAVNNPKSDPGDLKRFQTKIIALPVSQLDKDERTAYWKNRLLLAEKIKDLDEIKISAKYFLKQNNVSSQQAHWARSLQVFAYEMLFEFQSAYNIAKKTKFPKLSKADTALKLGVLAELAGNHSRAKGHYEEFIKKTSSVRKANTIRAKLVSQSRSPWTLLTKYLPRLRRTPDILASVALETFGRYTNYDKAEKVLNSQRQILKYPEGQTLHRFIFLKEYWGFDKKLRAHRISQSSQRKLSQSLQARMNLLAESEKWVLKAAKTKDWTLQIITLDRLTDSYGSVYSVIMGLNAPRGLNKKQRAEYKTLLAQQAQPYKSKKDRYGEKANEFWSNSSALDSLDADYKKADPSVRRLIKDELMALKSRAPKSTARKISRILDQKVKSPSHRKITSAYEDVKSRPFSTSRLETLIELEEQRAKNPTLVSYLVQRKQSLKGVQ